MKLHYSSRIANTITTHLVLFHKSQKIARNRVGHVGKSYLLGLCLCLEGVIYRLRAKRASAQYRVVRYVVQCVHCILLASHPLFNLLLSSSAMRVGTAVYRTIRYLPMYKDNFGPSGSIDRSMDHIITSLHITWLCGCALLSKTLGGTTKGPIEGRTVRALAILIFLSLNYQRISGDLQYCTAVLSS